MTISKQIVTSNDQPPSSMINLSNNDKFVNLEVFFMKKALVFYGGWDGHEPDLVAAYMGGELLEAKGLNVKVTDDMTILEDKSYVESLHVIVPVVTMDKITKEQEESISEAVASGVGLVGCHGGMCDAFRESVLWQFITGGNWVSHPGGDGMTYTVNIANSSSKLVEGLSDFEVSSEHYYLHVDPAVEVLATTRFPHSGAYWYHSSNKAVDMPIAWTKRWGHGRVYYTSLGHHADIVQMPEVTELISRGLDWAIEGKDTAIDNNLSSDDFKSEAKMF